MDPVASNFRIAHASDGDWDQMTSACLAQLDALSADANLGFIYVTDSVNKDLRRVVDRLRHATGIDNWVGTIGFGVCATGVEYFDVPAMVVMVGAMPGDSFCILPGAESPVQPLSPDLGDWVAKHRPVLGVMHGDPRNPSLDSLIKAIQQETGCFLVGGLTASRGEMDQVADQVIDGGVSGVLFADNVGVVTGLTQGCAPIGPVHHVTKGRDNVLVELDGEPAYRVFEQDIGELLARDLSRIEGYVHVALPIAESDTGDYLVRNLVGIYPEEGWISVGEHVASGDRVMFVRRDAPSAMVDLKRMLDDVTARATAPVRAALYYSCIARGPNLFGDGSVELGTIADALGDVPLVGFFANGEICNNRLYGYTGVLTLFT